MWLPSCLLHPSCTQWQPVVLEYPWSWVSALVMRHSHPFSLRTMCCSRRMSVVLKYPWLEYKGVILIFSYSWPYIELGIYTPAPVFGCPTNFNVITTMSSSSILHSMATSCSRISLILSKCSYNEALSSLIHRNWEHVLQEEGSTLVQVSCMNCFQVAAKVFPIWISRNIAFVIDSLSNIIASLSHQTCLGLYPQLWGKYPYLGQC